MNTTCRRAYQHRPSQRRPDTQRSPKIVDWDNAPELFTACVLPEQFFARHTNSRTECPETGLMRAVLTDALVCFQKGFSGGRRARRLAEEAEAWFLSDNDRWPFSFLSICAVLGLEPAYIRRGLQQWSQNNPRRRELSRLGLGQRQLAA
jgi:hypothetical protein